MTTHTPYRTGRTSSEYTYNNWSQGQARGEILIFQARKEHRVTTIQRLRHQGSAMSAPRGALPRKFVLCLRLICPRRGTFAPYNAAHTSCVSNQARVWEASKSRSPPSRKTETGSPRPPSGKSSLPVFSPAPVVGGTGESRRAHRGARDWSFHRPIPSPTYPPVCERGGKKLRGGGWRHRYSS